MFEGWTEKEFRFIITINTTIHQQPAEDGIYIQLTLEVGNTIYFDMPETEFSYWSISDRQRELIRTLIRSGHIDCFHSFGDCADSRDHALKAINELDSNNCPLFQLLPKPLELKTNVCYNF